MKKTTNERGITLIALIITIIVMLILVGVTINVALNGGLFEKAETATSETKKASEKEELIQIAVGEYNEKTQTVNANNVKTQVGANYTEDTSKSKEGETLVLQGKSGTFWEINLKSIEVKEYEKTKTIWDERGITSDNVKLDTLYYNDEIIITDNYDEGMTFGLYSEGDVCINYGSDIIAAENNNIGADGVASDIADTLLSSDQAQVFSNGITFFHLSDGSYWITIRYTSDNKVKVYGGETSDLDEDGNIPEEDAYFKGILLPQ